MRTPALLVALGLAILATPASAHRLKLFSTLENGTISGYAFFVGAGRAHGADSGLSTTPWPV